MYARIARRVVARFLNLAMEHDSPEALKKYLHDHPGAIVRKHHVKKQDEGKGKEDKGKGKEDKGKEDGGKEEKKPRPKKELDQEWDANEWDTKDALNEARSKHYIYNAADVAEYPEKYIRGLSKKMPRIMGVGQDEGWPFFSHYDEEKAKEFFDDLNKELDMLEDVMKENKDQTGGRVPHKYQDDVDEIRAQAKKFKADTQKVFEGYAKKNEALNKEYKALE